jgi:VanZ family protein
MDKRMKIFFRCWLPVILWAAGIFYLSSVPSLRSSLPSAWDFVLRKGAHLTEYAVLAMLVFTALKAMSIKGARLYVAAVSFCFFYALSDECHQMFVLGRHGSLVDAGIDAAGILAGLAAYLSFFRRKGMPVAA